MKKGSFENQVAAATDTYGSKFVTDLNLGFKLSDNIKLNVGSNNLFNVYPDQQDDWSEGGGYWYSVQMGISGAYYYAKLNLNFFKKIPHNSKKWVTEMYPDIFL